MFRRRLEAFASMVAVPALMLIAGVGIGLGLGVALSTF